MSRLVETIRAVDGRLLNITLHNERMIKSLFGVFGHKTFIDLEKTITVPETAGKGIFKCRVEYDTVIRKVEFLPYVIKPVRNLKLIIDNKIDYSFKFIDRTEIERLISKREGCDDIIVVKNGCVTDSSYANLIFRESSGNWVTPTTYLLPGIRRASLLQEGIITEKTIRQKDINNYSEVKLINAMIGIEDSDGIKVVNII